MRLIARQHHASTDISSDVDLTDWDAVDRFALDFAERVRAATASASTSAG